MGKPGLGWSVSMWIALISILAALDPTYRFHAGIALLIIGVGALWKKRVFTPTNPLAFARSAYATLIAVAIGFYWVVLENMGVILPVPAKDLAWAIIIVCMLDAVLSGAMK
jgi:hypothetical protein